MAREHFFEARLDWTGANGGPVRDYEGYSREYRLQMAGKPDLAGSAAVPFRGDGSLPNPEDLLLASVAACHLLSYLAECARAGMVVMAYEDECTARMTFHDGKMRIVEAHLKPRVRVSPESDLSKAESLHERAHEVCFIANSVAFPIHCEPTIYT
ncbi:OsmC family protein [soil metagenome]